MIFPGALEMMILQTLKRNPMHGYALAKPALQEGGPDTGRLLAINGAFTFHLYELSAMVRSACGLARVLPGERRYQMRAAGFHADRIRQDRGRYRHFAARTETRPTWLFLKGPHLRMDR